MSLLLISSKKETENMSEGGLEELDDLMGESAAKKVVNMKKGSPQPHQDAQGKYVRKPISEINVADLLSDVTFYFAIRE